MTSQPRRFAASTSSRSGRPTVRFRPALETLEDRTVLSTIYGVTPGNVLIRFDSATPGTVTTIGVISGLSASGGNETVRGIDFRPRTGQLYASTVTTASATNSVIFTYRINPLNAGATFVGQTAAAVAGAGDVPTGYDFNPTVDRIRYVNANDENVRLDPNNGALAGGTTDTVLTPSATTTIIAQAYDRNWNRQTISAPANNAIPTTLYAIDRDASQLAIQGGINGTPSPNGGVITDLAPLGFTLNAANDGGFDINARGDAFAALTDAADNLTRLYRINLVAAATVNPVATSVGLIGNGQTEVRGIAIVPEGIIIAGADAGAPPRVRVFDAGTGALKAGFLAYAPGFKGGVRVAAGDVTGDGVSDIITASGTGIPGRVRVFDGRTGAVVSNFFPFGTGNKRGVFVAAGDVNADGWDDIVTGMDAGGAPLVNVFSGRTGGIITSFLAYGAGFKGGVRVAAADFDLNGPAEIITAKGAGRGHIRIFNGTGAPWAPTPPPGAPAANIPNSFFAYGPNVTGGAYVAAGNIFGDGQPELITGPGKPAPARVNTFIVVTGALFQTFLVYPRSFLGGARVAVADINRDGRLELLTAPGPGPAKPVRFLNVSGAEVKAPIFPFGAGFNLGVFISGQLRS